MLKVARTVERVASTNVSVMLLGASGTGKELLARAVHERSDRSAAPFVAINCAAIPENLLEAELFGYERGAFTGAVKTNVGKIELAQGGTLFLDEVGDIPLPLQVKLLRFLQERVIERIGGRQPIAVDTRIVCATHQDLEAMIANGRFREDLYYRLAEVVVKIPSLAERAGDAVLLARHFTNLFAREMNPKIQGLAPDALAAVEAYGWPGNVRELENRIKRAVIMADGKMVGAADLDLPGKAAADGDLPINLRAAREVADRKAIRQALDSDRKQYFRSRQAVGDQPADALRPSEAVPADGLRLWIVRLGHIVGDALHRCGGLGKRPGDRWKRVIDRLHALMDHRPRVGDLPAEIPVEIGIVAPGKVADGSRLVPSSGAATLGGGFDLTDWQVEEGLRHRLHHVCQPVRGRGVGELRWNLDLRRRRRWRRSGCGSRQHDHRKCEQRYTHRLGLLARATYHGKKINQISALSAMREPPRRQRSDTRRRARSRAARCNGRTL